jgi:hypothetical protein
MNNIMWMFIGCGLRHLVPLVGSLLILVTLRVYTGGHSAVVSLLGYFLVVWFVGSLNSMNHTRQYMIVYSDTSDQHQYSEIVRTATNTAQTTQWTTNAHRSRTHQTFHRYSTRRTETESTIIEYGTWRYPIRKRGSPRKTQ